MLHIKVLDFLVDRFHLTLLELHDENALPDHHSYRKLEYFYILHLTIYNPFFLSASKSIGAFIARSSGVLGTPGVAEEANM